MSCRLPTIVQFGYSLFFVGYPRPIQFITSHSSSNTHDRPIPLLLISRRIPTIDPFRYFLFPHMTNAEQRNEQTSVANDFLFQLSGLSVTFYTIQSCIKEKSVHKLYLLQFLFLSVTSFKQLFSVQHPVYSTNDFTLTFTCSEEPLALNILVLPFFSITHLDRSYWKKIDKRC